MIAASKSGDKIEVCDHKVIISRKMGMKTLLQGLKGQKEIPIRSIVALQFKPASMFISGYIQLTLTGGSEAKGGWQQAGLDENTIEFIKSEESQFRKVKELLDAKIEAISNPVAVQAVQQAAIDPIAQLERLAALRVQGVLSDEEFAIQKAKLLGTKQSAPSATQTARQAPAPVRTIEQTVACPNCKHPLRLVTIKLGDNWCPQCKDKFVAEQ